MSRFSRRAVFLIPLVIILAIIAQVAFRGNGGSGTQRYAYQGGSASFLTPLSETSTRVDLTIDYKARSVIAKMGAAAGMDDRLAETVLREFKRVVESRGTPGAGGAATS